LPLIIVLLPLTPPPPTSTLFPYTTLFRSHHQEALCGVFAEALRRCVEHPLLLGRRRTCLATEAVDRRIAVGVDERREGLHEMERRALEPRAVRGVHVDARTAAPHLTARDQLDLDDPFRAEQDAHVAVGVLARAGHHDADGLPQGHRDLGMVHDLAEVR